MTTIQSLESDLQEEFSFLECFTKYVQKTDSHVLELARSCLEDDEYRLLNLEVERCVNLFLQSRKTKSDILKKINHVLETPLVEIRIEYKNYSIYKKIPIQNIDKTFKNQTLYGTQNTQYIGETVDGEPHGSGKLVDGHWTYIGNFVNGLHEGYGEKTYTHGDIEKGEWHKGFLHGKGFELYDERKYEGEFRYGEYEGFGTMNDDEGIYEGNWKDNSKEGQGIMKYRNGDVYEGLWKRDLKEGQGVMKEKNGNVYEGSWESDRKHQGVVKFTNGDIFEGNLYPSTKGILKFKNGDIFDGEVSKFPSDSGSFHGSGKYTYLNGDVFEGHMFDKQLHGKITYTNGNVFKGSIFLLDKRRSGKLTLQNGDSFDGIIVDNIPQDGRFRIREGDIQGYLENGKNNGVYLENGVLKECCKDFKPNILMDFI